MISMLQLVTSFRWIQRVCGDWCSLKDVGLLDSAVCNRLSRPHLIQALEWLSTSSINELSFYEWAQRRKVLLTQLHVSAGRNTFHADSLGSFKLDKVTHIVFGERSSYKDV